MKSLTYIQPEGSAIPVLEVPLSKSVANRWLVLEAIFPKYIIKKQLSEAADTQILREALESNESEIDLGAAGTAMRFATAFFSAKQGAVTLLHGTDRMHERPIQPLVNALRSLGAEIRYEGEEGYPPLLIYGRHLRGGEVYIPADMSSQFISALMLVAPATQDGLLINRTSKTVSQPYIDMTSSVLRQAGITVEEDNNRIHVHGKPTEVVEMPSEGDWSAAAAFVAWTAVSGQSVSVKGLSRNSIQGDLMLIDWAEELGVEGEWSEGNWVLRRTHIPEDDLHLDMLDHPDLAQSIIMAAFAQGRGGKVTGLNTLRIKETDRINALVECMRMLGGETTDTGGALYWSPADELKFTGETFQTYDDHRMAMALAPLAALHDISIDDENVVRKSFPKFWEEMAKTGLRLS
ncbi:MAG: 3-phosphoshikimate 1-carboxyvinyltransferase [Flavobacteriia bacterium]|nr:3-phosphoshikimate 1-carboxyvinyltransferase [Flavobacteriia bacterium]